MPHLLSNLTAGYFCYDGKEGEAVHQERVGDSWIKQELVLFQMLKSLDTESTKQNNIFHEMQVYIVSQAVSPSLVEFSTTSLL